MQTVQRIQSVFPANQQNAITVQLANSLQAIVAQKLLEIEYRLAELVERLDRQAR